jgi:hypothetical protein
MIEMEETCSEHREERNGCRLFLVKSERSDGLKHLAIGERMILRCIWIEFFWIRIGS